MKHFLALVFFSLISALAIAQNQTQSAFSEGVRLLRAEKYVEAERSFSIAISQGLNQDGLKLSLIYKAFAFNGQGKYDSAIYCFDKAIEIDPLDPASYTDRGKTFTYREEYNKAIADFNNVLKLDSIGKQSEAAYYYLGRIKMLQRKNEEAVGHFDNLLKLVQNDAEAYFLRGTAKSNIMNIDGSIEDFDLAIKYNPKYMEAYANRGVQKINRIPTSQKIGKKIKCFEDPCSDLLKAKKFGDRSVDDMIYLYCSKCQ